MKRGGGGERGGWVGMMELWLKKSCGVIDPKVWDEADRPDSSLHEGLRCGTNIRRPTSRFANQRRARMQWPAGRTLPAHPVSVVSVDFVRTEFLLRLRGLVRTSIMILGKTGPVLRDRQEI